MKLSRRRLIALASVMMPGLFGKSEALAKACPEIPRDQVTPDLPLGPFHPLFGAVKAHSDFDRDLTRIEGRSESALGEVVVIRGTVKNNFCEPVAGANIEIWQACASGRYDHPGEYYTVPKVDPNFQYMAQIVTDQKGEYQIKTVIPGAYPLDDKIWRAPHVHFHVSHRGHFDLITQMYFSGQPLNDKDGVLAPLTPEARKLVIREPVGKDKDGHKIYEFDIVPRKLSWTKFAADLWRRRARDVG